MLDRFEIKIFPVGNPFKNMYDLEIFTLNVQSFRCRYFSNKIFIYEDSNSKIIGIEIEDVLNFNNIENIKDSHLIPQEIKDCWNWIKKTNYIQKQLVFK